MSANPWTPGPWRIEDERLVAGGRMLADFGEVVGAKEADLRLIAAAPDMAELLAACRRPHRHVEEDCWFCCSAPHGGEWNEEHTTCDDSRSGKPCDCGADEFNARIDALLSRIRGES